MDNASGNVPNVPPGSGGEETIELNATPSGPLAGEQGGSLPSALSAQETPAAPAGELLDNNVKLLSPIPVDRDPPPLSDVNPLSAPVAVSQVPAEQARPAGVRVQASVSAQPVPVPPPAQPPAPTVQPAVPEPYQSEETQTAETPSPGSAPRPAYNEVQIPEKPAVPGPVTLPSSPIEKAPYVESAPATDLIDVSPDPGEQEAAEAAEEVPVLALDQLLGKPEPEPATEVDNDLPLIEPEPVDNIEPEQVAPAEEAPLLEVAGEQEEEAETGSEPLPPLVLTPEDGAIDSSESPEIEDSPVEEVESEDPTPESVEEEVAAPQEEEGKTEKTVFQQETLDAQITQKVITPGGQQPENYVKNEFFVSEGAEDPWILPASAAAGVAANQKKRRIAGKVSPGLWSTFTTIFFFGSLFLIGGLLIAWSMRGVIADKIEARVAKKVEEAGYYVEYDEWNYDPVRGLVLKELTVFENAARAVPYARVDNIGLNTDVFALLKKKDARGLKKTVSFKDSNLTLYHEGGEIANFKELKGALELDQNQIGLQDLKGQLEGTLFEVEGDIVLSPDSNAVALWNTPSSPGNQANAEAVKARKSVSTGITTEKVVAQLAQSGPVIIRDDPPEETRKPMFAPRTDIVIPPAALGEKETAKPEPTEETPPATEEESSPPVSSEIPAIPPSGSDTSAIPETIVVPPADVASSSNSASLEADPGNNDSSTELPSLAFLGDITPYFQIKSTGKLPLITSEVDLDFTDSETPRINAKGRLTGESITMEGTVLEGIKFHSVDSPYSYDHQKGQLNLPGFKIGHGEEGVMTGNAKYNLPTKVLDVSNLRSSMDLAQLLKEIDPAMKTSLQNIEFFDAPEILIRNGRIPLEEPLNGKIDFSYEQWKGIRINSNDRKLPINQIRGNFKLDKGVLSVHDLKARVLDGPVDAIGSMRLNEPTFPFDGSIKVRGLPMESIAEYAAIESKYLKGNLDLDYKGTISKEISELTGFGSVKIQDSQLYKVPVIGPIQRLLGAAIPVFGTEIPSSLDGNFDIKSGLLTTPDLLVRGDGTRVEVKGQVDLAHKLTAFSASAGLEGPLGFVTGLEGEMIEIAGDGSLYSPNIRLKGGSLPVAFAAGKVKTILGISDGSAEAMKAMMEEIAGNSGGVGSLIKGVGGRPVAKPVIDKATDNAAGIIKGIKNIDPDSVGRGLQGLIRGGQ